MRRALVLAVLLSVGGQVRGEEIAPALDSVVVDARVAPDGSAAVSMRYRLRPRTAVEVRFLALRLDGARAVNVRAFSGTSEISFHTDDSTPERLEGRVRVPPDAASEGWDLRLDYEVLASDETAEGVTLPLLVARWPPEETLPSNFRADVQLAGGGVLQAAFPSEYESIPPVDVASEATAYRFELAVVPSLLRFVVRDRPAAITVERIADLTAVAVLVLAALVGWRRMREQWA